ncbi:hypothetical protein NML43_13155 [Rhodopseudomonas palustris]|jgi:hypothetical protein|uniref:hypothetical protein n=1 Tax=Rhodopseudomonas palustris TaxID=1076 RepID=UPI0020CDDA4C|nr:hypothetical protein [Rhodopseudomonas palustris]MBR2120132.1 hypothetical protein [Afipia sp.]MCP9628036.1 hypothetical protein [Rhodopseudomonas palustris]
MKRFLELMSHDPAVEACFISQMISLVIDTMIDFSRPLDLMLWPRTDALPVRVLVIGANRDRAAALRRGGIDGCWTEDRGAMTYTGYLEGQPHITVALHREQDMLEVTFL